MYKVAARIEGAQIPWEEGCPIILEAIQISRDAEKASAYLQARVKNVGARCVEYIRIVTTLSLSNENAVNAAFEYFDISIKPGESAALPAQPTEQVNVVGIEAKTDAVKTDVSEWKSAGEGGAIPEGGRLLVLDPELLSERRKLFDENGLATAHADYLVQSGSNWWVCACGQLNVRRKTCWLCRAERAFLEKTEDAQLLQQSAAKRAAADKKAEQEAQRAEEAKRERIAKVKRGFKIAIPIVVAVGILAIAIAAAVKIIIPQNAYNEAMDEYNAGNYEAAFEKFDGMNYSNSEEMKHDAGVALAQKALDEGDYPLAIEWFDKLGNESSVVDIKLRYVKAHMDVDDETTVQFVQELADMDYKDAKDLYRQLANVRVETKVVGAGQEVNTGDIDSMPDLGNNFDWEEGKYGGITLAYRILSDLPVKAEDEVEGTLESVDGFIAVGDRVRKTSGSDWGEVLDLAGVKANEWQLRYVPIFNNSAATTYRISLEFNTKGGEDRQLADTVVTINHPKFAGYALPD